MDCLIKLTCCSISVSHHVKVQLQEQTSCLERAGVAGSSSDPYSRWTALSLNMHKAARAATGAPSFNHGALSGLERVPVAHVQHADRLSFTDWQLWLCFCNGTAKPIINVIALMFWARTSIVWAQCLLEVKSSQRNGCQKNKCYLSDIAKHSKVRL